MERFRSIVDVHLLLLRADRVLLARRHNTGYADGRLNLVSGHLEAGEDIITAAIREAEEEVGVTPLDLSCVHVMHLRSPEGQSRVGFFFSATKWDGEPVNREPDKCSELVWHRLDALPADVVDYPASALRRIRDGKRFSVHGWG